MAYPYMIPTTPTTYYPGQQYAQPTTSTNSNNGLLWVQGETGAKSYLVAPNCTVLLMDSEAQKFYIKSADASGMPIPLRVFEYKEVGATPTVEYVTKEEFEKALSELKGVKTDG